jgi:hypothetical protein
VAAPNAGHVVQQAKYVQTTPGQNFGETGTAGFYPLSGLPADLEGHVILRYFNLLRSIISDLARTLEIVSPSCELFPGEADLWTPGIILPSKNASSSRFITFKMAICRPRSYPFQKLTPLFVRKGHPIADNLQVLSKDLQRIHPTHQCMDRQRQGIGDRLLGCDAGLQYRCVTSAQTLHADHPDAAFNQYRQYLLGETSVVVVQEIGRQMRIPSWGSRGLPMWYPPTQSTVTLVHVLPRTRVGMPLIRSIASILLPPSGIFEFGPPIVVRMSKSIPRPMAE